jgi:sugar O-acyltransferase (sialic acid O-acetyltransferase NeuD family)
MALIIVVGGSGQHASVIYEAALLSGVPVAGFATADGSPSELLDCRPLGTIVSVLESDSFRDRRFVVACGANDRRMELTELLTGKGVSLASVFHPAAVISPSSRIDDGSAILAGAIIGPRAALGRGVIVNHGASVDHDCCIEDFANLSPGARLGGRVHVGGSVFIGMNATVLPGLRLGERAVIGAGAVVTRDVEPNVTVVGVPARRLVHNQSGGLSLVG